MELRPMGSHAVLVEEPPHDPASWSLALRSLALPGIVDIVPAGRTVLIVCEGEDSLRDIVARLGDITVDPVSHDPRTEVVIGVHYVGDDLHETAATIGRSVDDTIRLHTSGVYEVAFCGFAPGFAYLRGLPSELQLPRRHTPRTRVPAGSVAIASEYSAVYPSSSPGGWHLLGKTDMVMFDPERDQPALLQPGTIVRFEPR